MEPWDDSELSESELNRALKEWKVPQASPRLRRRVFPDNGPRAWWRRFWSTSIRVPLPIACSVLILLAVAAWRWQAATSNVATMSTSLGLPHFEPVREVLP